MSTPPLTVVHVDDSDPFLELTRSFLERLAPGIEYETLSRPDEVFERLERGGVDCVVSDYEMPGTDGLSLLRAMRERGSDLPFVLFTGKGSEEVASEAISADVSDYLQKGTDPSRFELLLHSVRGAVEQYRSNHLVYRVYEAMHLVDEGVSLVDEDGRFVYVNRSYAEMFGYEPDELVGKSWRMLYRNEADAEYVERNVMVDLTAATPWDGRTLHARQDGSLFYAEHHLGVTDSGLTVCRVKHEREAVNVAESTPPVVTDGGDEEPDAN